MARKRHQKKKTYRADTRKILRFYEEDQQNDIIAQSVLETNTGFDYAFQWPYIFVMCHNRPNNVFKYNIVWKSTEELQS